MNFGDNFMIWSRNTPPKGPMAQDLDASQWDLGKYLDHIGLAITMAITKKPTLLYAIISDILPGHAGAKSNGAK